MPNLHENIITTNIIITLISLILDKIIKNFKY